MNNGNLVNYEIKVDATTVYHSFMVNQHRVKKTKMIPWADYTYFQSSFQTQALYIIEYNNFKL